MFERPAAALAHSQALRPLEARRPWPEIALPLAVVAALLLDLTSDAQWGDLRLHLPLEAAAAAVALAAASASWLRSLRAASRSRSASAHGLVTPGVPEGTPYIDSVLWAALEVAMRRQPVPALGEGASSARISGVAIVDVSAIPCPPGEPAARKALWIATPLQIEGTLVLRRKALAGPDPQVQSEG